MHQSLYRKYRPKNLDEVVGQKIIVQILKNAIKNNTLSHAYLFAGPRGTGKTSVAKILAKMVNCENLNDYIPCDKCVNCTQYNDKQAVDINEIDAASNNGVEEIRELKSKINLVPSTGKYKIYIIDEVHMLSIGAFNALLKTLEEPPNHIIFILATTDPHKIPSTILSRCQRLDFKKIDEKSIFLKLKKICEIEKIIISDEALKQISYLSNGGMRDALSLLDQAISYSDNITIDSIHEINGTITESDMKNFLKQIINNNIENIFQKIDQFNLEGKDFYKLTEEFILYIRNILIQKNIPNYFENNKDEYDLVISIEELMNYIKVFNLSLYEMKNSINSKLIFELSILKILNFNKNNNIEEKDKRKMKENSVIPSNENKIDIEKLKNIRINNTLCNFNKKEYLEFKNCINQISELVLNKKYSEYVSLILDGEIKAFSNNYFIIMYENEKYVNEFNNNYKIIDEIFMKKIDKIKGIAVSNEEWQKIKENFNNKQVNYTYIEEEKNL